MFRRNKIPGCLHGLKFSYEISSWDKELINVLLRKLGGELQEIPRTGFFRFDISEVGCLTGIYGNKEAYLIINPDKQREILRRRRIFEDALLRTLSELSRDERG